MCHDAPVSPSSASVGGNASSHRQPDNETPPSCLVGGNPTKPSCSFYPCLHPAACLGKANDVYEGRYLESSDFFNERELAKNETSSDDKAVVDLALYKH